MGRNRYSQALKILKSKELDERLDSLREDSVPTNNTGLFKKYKLDIDQFDQEFTSEYWRGGDRENFQNITPTDFSQDFLSDNPYDTSGLIGNDGTVYAELPPEGEAFILGPIVDGFVSNGSESYTNIGYIQKDTRQFVLLARVDGQWKDGMNGDHSVWDGTGNGLTVYNENFTLEMAQWVQDKIVNNKYAKDVPYFYSAGSSQEINCPGCPENMKGGNGIAPVEFEEGSIFTPEQEGMIQVNLTQFFRDTNDRSTFEFQVGRLAAGMSIKQMGELMKKANERWGK